MSDVLINNYYVNARVAQLSNRLFGIDRFNRLAECADLSAAIRVLHEVQYGGSTSSDFEALMQHELYESVATMRQLCINPAEARFFLCAYDYHNAKVLMKCKYGRVSEQGLCFECSEQSVSQMRDMILADDYSAFSPLLAAALNDIDVEFANGNRSPRFIDVTLDRAMFAEMRECTKKSWVSALKEYFKFTVDSANLLLLFRSIKNKLVLNTDDFISGGKLDEILPELIGKEPQDIVDKFYLNDYQPFVRLCAGGEGGSLSNAQYYISQRKMDIISRDINMETAQPLLSYFVSKLAEIERIRLVLIGIKYGTDRDSIKAALAARV